MLRPVFFNFRIVSKSPAEISTPIGTVLELRSRANLPCLVKLAPSQIFMLFHRKLFSEVNSLKELFSKILPEKVLEFLSC